MSDREMSKPLPEEKANYFVFEQFVEKQAGEKRKGKVAKRLIVHVTGSKVEAGDVEKAAKIIFSQDQKFLQKEMTAKITFEPEKKFSVEFGKAAGKHEHIIEEGIVTDVSVRKITQLSQISETSYKETKKTFFQLLATPFVFIAQLISKRWHKEALTQAASANTKEVQKFLDEASCSNYQGFISFLEHTQPMVSEDPKASDTLKAAVKTGKSIVGEQEVEKVVNKIFKEIKDLYVGAQKLVPLGYFRIDEHGSQVFTPLLLTFTKEKDTVKIEIRSSDPRAPETMTYKLIVPEKSALEGETFAETLAIKAAITAAERMMSKEDMLKMAKDNLEDEELCKAISSSPTFIEKTGLQSSNKTEIYQVLEKLDKSDLIGLFKEALKIPQRVYEENLKKLLTHCVSLSSPQKSALSPEQAQRLGRDKEHIAIERTSPTTESMPTWQVLDVIARQCTDEKAFPPQMKMRELAAQESGVTLVQGYFKSFAPESPAACKALFLLETLVQHINGILPKLENFKPQEKLLILNELLSKYEHVHHALNQALGTGQSIEALAGELPQFRALQMHIEHVKKRRDELNVELGRARDIELQQASPTAFPAKVQLQVKTVASAASEKPVKPVLKSDTSNIEGRFQTLNKDIARKDFKEALKSFSELQLEIDKLVGAEEFELAKQYATRLLNLLPLPPTPPASYQFLDESWFPLSQVQEDFWASLPKEKLQEWRKQIEGATTCLWESKLKLGDKFATADELAAVATSQAIIFKMVLSEDKNPLFFEKGRYKGEICTVHMETLSQLLRDERYALSLDPEIHERIDALSSFFTSQAIDVYSRGREMSKTAIFLDDPSDPFYTKEDNPSKFFSSEPKDGLLSENLLALRKIQVMANSLSHPETHLYLNHPKPLIGQGKMVSWLKGLFAKAKELGGSEESLEKRVVDLKQQEVASRLSKMGRLTIAVTSSPLKDEPAIQIAPRDRTIDSEARDGLLYFAHGAQLEEFGLPSLTAYDHTASQTTVGSLDQQLMHADVGVAKSQSGTERVIDEYSSASYGSGREIWTHHEREVAYETLVDPSTSDELVRYAWYGIRPNATCWWASGHPSSTSIHSEAGWAAAALLESDPMRVFQSATLQVHNVEVGKGAEAYGERRIIRNGQLHEMSILNTLALIRNYPEYLKDVKMQRQLEANLFRPPFLSIAIERSPQAFLDSAELLCKHTQDALQRGDKVTASFLMHISTRLTSFTQNASQKLAASKEVWLTEKEKENVGEYRSLLERKKMLALIHNLDRHKKEWASVHARLAEIEKAVPSLKEKGPLLDKLDKIVTKQKIYDGIVKKFPTYTTKFICKDASGKETTRSGFEQLKSWSQERAVKSQDVEARIITSIYLLEAFELQAKEMGIDKFLTSLSSDDRVLLTKTYLTLAALPHAFGIAYLHQRGVAFVKELIPEIAADENFESEVLPKLAKEMGLPQTEWSKEPSRALYFNNPRGGFIDLSEGIYGGAREDTDIVALMHAPIEIQNHPGFKKVFGDEEIRGKLQHGKTPEEISFYCNFKGRNFRVEYNKITSQLRLYQDLSEIVAPGTSKPCWCLYHQLASPTKTHTDAALQHYGLWLPEGAQKGYVFFGEPTSTKKEEIFAAKIGQDGTVTELSPYTRPQLHAGFDPNGIKTKWLSPLHPERLILLQKGSALQEISVVGHDLRFVRDDATGQWQAAGRYTGFHWTDPSKDTFLPGTTQLFSLLGQAQKDVIIPVQRVTEEVTQDKLLIVPHKVKKALKNKETGEVVSLEFEKEPVGTKVLPIIELNSSGGKIETSASGFLYLAYLMAEKKDFKAAMHFLQRAEEVGIRKGEDKQFLEIVNFIRALPPTSLRPLAFKLKAELFIEALIEKRALPPLTPREYYERAKELVSLKEQYDTLFAKKGKPEMLAFTAEESEYYQHIVASGMGFLTERIEAKQEKVGRKWLAQPTTEELTNCIYMSALLKTTKKEKLDAIPYPSSALLKHFAEFMHQIQMSKKGGKEIKANDLKALFGEIILQPGETEEMRVAIDTARKILLFYANTDKEDMPAAFDTFLSQIESLKINDADRDKTFTSISQAASLLSEGLEHVSVLELPVETTITIPPQLVFRIQTLANELEQEDSVLTALEKHELKKALKAIKEQCTTLKDHTELSEVEFLLKFSEQNVNLAELRREGELERGIAKKLEKLGAVSQAALEQEKLKVRPSGWQVAINIGKFFDSVPKTSLPTATVGAYFTAKRYDDDELAAMRTEEDALQKKGVEAAAKSLEDELQNRCKIKDLKTCDALADEVQLRIDTLQDKAKKQKEMCFAKLAKLRDTNPQIKELLRNRSLLGDDALFDKVVQIYQSREGIKDQELEDLISKIDIEGTELKLITQAIKKLQEIKNKKLIGKKGKEDELIRLSTEARMLIEAGAKHERYNDLNPIIARKLLVTEFRRGIALLPEQIAVISKHEEKAMSLSQLRMGRGKTAYVVPILVKNVVVVPKALREMSRESWDATTRELFANAAYDVRLDQGTLKSSVLIAQEVDKILTAQLEDGYILLDVEQLATVKHELVAVNEEILPHVNGLRALQAEKAVLEKEFLEKPSKELEKKIEGIKSKILQKKEQIQKVERRSYWLRRLESIFEGKEPGVQAQFLADEVDSLFDVDNEINRALPGDRRAPHKHIVNASRFFFKTILERQFADDSPLQTVQAALKNGRQDFLSQDQVNKALKEFATLYATEKGLDPTQFLKFVFGTDEEITIGDEEAQAMKTLLSSTLPSALLKSPEVEFGIQSKTGCTVGPKDSKAEKANTNYGDEFELVVYNMLQYVTKGPHDAFLKETLNTMRLQKPEDYKALLEKALVAQGQRKDARIEPKQEEEILLSYLKSKDAWEDRLNIFDKYVLSANRITLSEEEQVLNVQDVIRGISCGGLSGTMTPYALPEGFDKGGMKEEEARKVEGETFLRLAMGHKDGFDTAAETVKDDKILSKLQEKLQSPEVTAVVNIGLGLEGKDTIQIISELRQKVKRPFVFVHPQERVAYIWKPDSKSCEVLGNEKIPANSVVYYDPQDSVGTHFDIPPGRIIYTPGATTTKPKLVQGLFRARGLGVTHVGEFLVPESFAARIRTRVGKKEGSPITFGDVVRDNQAVTVERDATKNMKKQLTEIHGIAYTGLRGILDKVQEEERQSDYWGEKAVELDDSDFIANTEAHAYLHEKIRPWLVRKKDTRFDSEATHKKDVFEVLQGRVLSEISKLEKLQSELAVLVRSKSISTKVRSKLNDAVLEIEQIKEKLKEKQKEFTDAASKQTHAKHLPQKVKSSISTSSGSQSQEVELQLAEQLQLQTQVELSLAEQEKTIIDVDRIKEPILYPPPHWWHIGSKELLNKRRTKDIREPDGVAMLTRDIRAFQGCKSLKPNVGCTENAAQILNTWPNWQGQDLVRLMVIKDTTTGDSRVFLASKYDEVGLDKDLRRMREEDIDVEYSLGSYTIDRTAATEKETGISSHQVLTRKAPTISDKEIRQIAEAKLYLGFEDFTKKEKQELAKWLKELTKEAFIELEGLIKEKGSPKQLALIRGLITSER
jgi:hypothetical protein